MTINSIKNELKGLNEEQLINKASELLREVSAFFDEANKIVKGKKFDLDFIELILVCAIASDGEMDRDEYSAYEELCQCVGVKSRSYSDCLNFINTGVDAVDVIKDFPQILRGLFETAERMDVFEKLTIAVACLLMNDGNIEGKELDMLQLFINDGSTSGVESSSLSSSQTKKIQIVKFDGTMTRDDDKYYISVGAELKNENVAHCARNVNVKIIVKDSSGRILETSENRIDYIDSNAVFYFGDEFYVDRGTPANYSIQVNCDDFVKAPANSTFSDGITCSHYNLRNDSWGDTEFTGNVHNAYDKKLYVDLYFVFYDSDGDIVGGTNTYVSLYGNSDDVFSSWLHTNTERDKVRCSPTFDFTDVVD